MTQKQLSKLTRRDLLELLVDEMEENEKLRTQLEEANRQLEERKIVMEKSGSLAEAALRLSGIFDAADKATAIFRDNVASCSDTSRLSRNK